MSDAPHRARRTPALVDAPASATADAAAAVSIRAIATAARLSLRLSDADATAVGVAADFALAIPLNSSAGSVDCCSARLGPNEWLLIDDKGDTETIAARVESVLADRLHALIDVGHRHVGFAVSGRHARDVLNAGCPLDLAERAFPSGAASRTLLGKAEIVLMRFDRPARYRVECARSFAPYVRDFLQEAAREFL